MRKRLGFIGAGHITEMLLTKITASGVIEPGDITVSDVDSGRLQWMEEHFSVKTTTDNRQAFLAGDVTFVCVQPRIVPAVVEDLKGIPVDGKALLTIAAGVPMAVYEGIGDKVGVMRALPNPPSQVGCAIIPYAKNRHATPEMEGVILEILSLLGKCIPMHEDGISIVTSLSSPAPVFLFLDSMVEAGVLCGLSRPDSVQVAHQTVLGCLRLWESKEGKTFSDLIADASTPAGVSVESVYVMDRHAFRGIVKEAYFKGAERARALSGAK